MHSFEEVVKQIVPNRTVLFLGAGASVPSGGPTAADLSKHLQETLAGGETISEDLSELCSILENRYGRKALVEAVRKRLNSLEATGGLLVLPEYEWETIYTTNFDKLVESAFNKCGKKVVPVRSNYDYGKIEGSEGIPLLKLHGCISCDLIDGHKARIVLTERDYDAYEDFRQTLFARLKLDMQSKDVLLIGYSLKDPHIRRDLKYAARLHREAAAPGRLFAVIYEADRDRAKLAEDQGFQVAFGGIDDVMAAISSECPPGTSIEVLEEQEGELPINLRAVTVEVEQASNQLPNHVKLFNGYPATYADISNGYTFERSCEDVILQRINNGSICETIIGVAGVGKTTTARRINLALCKDHGYYAWEHKGEYPLKSGSWLEMEGRLRQNSLKAVLFIDNCPDFLRQVNILVDGLSKVDRPAVRLLLVGERSQWVPRTKSPRIFSRGKLHELSQLDEAEINRLVNLLDVKPDIRNLVDHRFTILSKQRQIHILTRKCSADMFVALKHVFTNEALDTILLKEYSKLDEELQDIYRTVSALEAAGTRVHRQLVIRLLSIPASFLFGALSVLEGLVDEYNIRPDLGLYGWKTRHEVVSQIVTRYKYADQDAFFHLLKDVIANLNPTLWVERRTLNDLCNTEFGIKRLTYPDQRLELYNMLIDKAPGERVPRHRLIHELLQLTSLDEADQAIRDFENSLGVDSPVHRYKVLLLIARAQHTKGLLKEDRRALLLEARRVALNGLDRFPYDKYAYMVFEHLGFAYYDLVGTADVIDEAIEIMKRGVEKILDPQLSARLTYLERQRIPLEGGTRVAHCAPSEARCFLRSAGDGNAGSEVSAE